MKRIFYLLTGLLIIKTQVAGQNKIGRSAGFKDYGQYLQPYIGISHNADYKSQFTDYCEDYLIIMKFNIDTTGNIINAKSISDRVPESVLKYIVDLFNKTDRQWQPQIKDCKEIVSDTITCFFYLTNKTVTPYERGQKISEEMNRTMNDPDYVAPDHYLGVSQKSATNYCYVFLRI